MLSNESNDLSKFLTPTPIIISQFSKNRRIVVLGQTQFIGLNFRILRVFQICSKFGFSRQTWVQIQMGRAKTQKFQKPENFGLARFLAQKPVNWKISSPTQPYSGMMSLINYIETNVSTSFQKPKPDHNLISRNFWKL